jgi:hypothetical protein
MRLLPEDVEALDGAIGELQGSMRLRLDRSEVMRALAARFVKDPKLREEVGAEIQTMRQTPGIDLGL